MSIADSSDPIPKMKEKNMYGVDDGRCYSQLVEENKDLGLSSFLGAFRVNSYDLIRDFRYDGIELIGNSLFVLAK